MDSGTAAALVEESAKRAGVIWIRRQGDDAPPQPVWHAWVEDSVYLLTGGLEQPLPAGLTDDGARAEVTVPSKETRARLVVWVAEVSTLRPNDVRWDAVATALKARRLNAPDGEDAPQRWARECIVSRLRPTGQMLEEPDPPGQLA